MNISPLSWNATESLYSCKRSLERIVKFPELTEEPVPFYRNPWKCLAVVPISCQIVKIAAILNEYNHFVDGDIPVVPFEGVATFITWLFIEKYASADEFSDSHLLRALYINSLLTTLNFGFDLTSSTLKVSHAAITAFLQWGLISYANEDKPEELYLATFEKNYKHNSHNEESFLEM